MSKSQYGVSTGRLPFEHWKDIGYMPPPDESHCCRCGQPAKYYVQTWDQNDAPCAPLCESHMKSVATGILGLVRNYETLDQVRAKQEET